MRGTSIGIHAGLAVALVAGLAACGGGPVNPGGCNTGPVSVTPSMLLMAPGSTARIVAVGLVPGPGCTALRSDVRWNAQDTTIARVQADTGLSAVVTARAAGSTFVIATFLADTTVRAAALVTVGTGRPPAE